MEGVIFRGHPFLLPSLLQWSVGTEFLFKITPKDDQGILKKSIGYQRPYRGAWMVAIAPIHGIYRIELREPL